MTTRVIARGLRLQALRRYKGMCAKCGLPSDKVNSLLEIHHILPVMYGGTDDITNLIPLCHECHKYAPNTPKEFWSDYMKKPYVPAYGLLLDGILYGITLAEAIMESPHLNNERLEFGRIGAEAYFNRYTKPIVIKFIRERRKQKREDWWNEKGYVDNLRGKEEFKALKNLKKVMK